MTLVERFWNKVQKSDGCWEWTAFRKKNGYGYVRRGGKAMYAHRISWEMENGPIPNKMCVCHSCDNPACVNPEHLWIGTQAENLNDMRSKGRFNTIGRSRGSAHRWAKIDENDVCEIRRRLLAGESMAQIARDFNVTRSAIYKIKCGKTWANGK